MSTCPSCRVHPATEAVADSRGGREVLLCADCAELERGRLAFESMRLAGNVDADAAPTDDALRAMARAMDSLWSDAPDDAFAGLEEIVDGAGDRRALADLFRDIGRRVGSEPAPAVRDFLARHGGAE